MVPREPDTIATHDVTEQSDNEAKFVKKYIPDLIQIESVVEATNCYGCVDIMVNNAAVVQRQGLSVPTEGSFHRITVVKIQGVHIGCKFAAQDMIYRGSQAFPQYWLRVIPRDLSMDFRSDRVTRSACTRRSRSSSPQEPFRSCRGRRITWLPT